MGVLLEEGVLQVVSKEMATAAAGAFPHHNEIMVVTTTKAIYEFFLEVCVHVYRACVVFSERFHTWPVRWSAENHTATRLTYGPWVRRNICLRIYRDVRCIDMYVQVRHVSVHIHYV